jgi:hypothetical protein
MFNVPVFPPEAAVMVVVPAVTAVINPVEVTLATAGLLEVHVVAYVVNTLLVRSRAVAVACVDCPTKNADGTTAVNVTEATVASVTKIVADATFPSTDATIVAWPFATPVTTPFNTVATVVLDEAQVTDRPAITESR